MSSVLKINFTRFYTDHYQLFYDLLRSHFLPSLELRDVIWSKRVCKAFKETLSKTVLNAAFSERRLKPYLISCSSRELSDTELESILLSILTSVKFNSFVFNANGNKKILEDFILKLGGDKHNLKYLQMGLESDISGLELASLCEIRRYKQIGFLALSIKQTLVSYGDREDIGFITSILRSSLMVRKLDISGFLPDKEFLSVLNHKVGLSDVSLSLHYLASDVNVAGEERTKRLEVLRWLVGSIEGNVGLKLCSPSSEDIHPAVRQEFKNAVLDSVGTNQLIQAFGLEMVRSMDLGFGITHFTVGEFRTLSSKNQTLRSLKNSILAQTAEDLVEISHIVRNRKIPFQNIRLVLIPDEERPEPMNLQYTRALVNFLKDLSKTQDYTYVHLNIYFDGRDGYDVEDVLVGIQDEKNGGSTATEKLNMIRNFVLGRPKISFRMKYFCYRGPKVVVPMEIMINSLLKDYFKKK